MHVAFSHTRWTNRLGRNSFSKPPPKALRWPPNRHGSPRSAPGLRRYMPSGSVLRRHSTAGFVTAWATGRLDWARHLWEGRTQKRRDGGMEGWGIGVVYGAIKQANRHNMAAAEKRDRMKKVVHSCRCSGFWQGFLGWDISSPQTKVACRSVRLELYVNS